MHGGRFCEGDPFQEPWPLCHVKHLVFDGCLTPQAPLYGSIPSPSRRVDRLVALCTGGGFVRVILSWSPGLVVAMLDIWSLTDA